MVAATRLPERLRNCGAARGGDEIEPSLVVRPRTRIRRSRRRIHFWFHWSARRPGGTLRLVWNALQERASALAGGEIRGAGRIGGRCDRWLFDRWPARPVRSCHTCRRRGLLPTV